MTPTWDSEESIRRWDAFAEKWAAHTSTEQGELHREVLLNPVLFELLGDVRGKRILDAGCGEGYLSRLLARRGANVTAVDYSKEMLRIAQERTPNDLDIEFRHGNCERLDFLADESSDIVVSNIVLNDLADYESAIREAHRVLVPDGVFILAIIHPCFGTPGARWQRDERGEKLFWKLDNYFGEGPYEEQVLAKDEYLMLSFHRTLTSYVRAILRTGFTLEDLLEPKPSEEMMRKYPAFRDDLRMCHFLVFKLRK